MATQGALSRMPLLSLSILDLPGRGASTPPGAILRAQIARRQVPIPAPIAVLVMAGLAAAIPTDSSLSFSAAASTTGRQAWVATLRGRHEEAVRLAAEALDRDRCDPRAVHAMASALEALGRDGEAQRRFDSLRADPDGEACGLLGLADLALMRKDPAAAESLLAAFRDRERRAAEGAGDRARIASLLDAVARYEARRFAEAESLLAAALSSADTTAAPLETCWARLLLGTLLASTPRQDEASAHLGAALQIARALDLPVWEGQARLELSSIERRRMRLDEALDHRRSALAAYERAGSLEGQARSLHYIGVIEIIKGDFTRATRSLNRGLDLAREAGSAGVAAGCLGDLGALARFIGDETTALRMYEEAISTGSGERSREWVGGMQGNIGLLYTGKGMFEQALAWYARALSTLEGSADRRSQGTVGGQMGRCLCAMGRGEEGLARLREARQIARQWEMPLSEVWALIDIGSCHTHRGGLAAAEKAFAEARRLASKIGSYEAEASALTGSAHCARTRGRREEALLFIDRAMGIVEGARARSRGATAVQAGLFGTKNYVYADAIDLLWEISEDDPARRSELAERAFECAQRSKARALSDLLAEAGIDLRSRGDPAYRERETRMRERMEDLVGSLAADTTRLARDSVEVEIARLEAEISLLEDDLRREDPRYAEVRYPEPCGLAEVQGRILGAGDCLLEYFTGDSASYLWIVKPDACRLVKLPPKRILEDGIRKLLPILSDYNALGGGAAYLVDPLEEVSRMVIGPALEDLSESRRVLVAPHGILHYLPFEVLLTEAGADSPEADGGFGSLPYLVLSIDLVYLPSASALLRLMERAGPPHAERTEILVVGDPIPPSRGEESVHLAVFEPARLGAIPFGREEIRSIVSIVGRKNAVVLERGEATLEGLKRMEREGPFRYLHVAAHGFLNETRPRFSGLLLSPDRRTGHDGFVTMGEIFGTELPCEQVVLSSCASALGEEVTGEGVVGMTRAFLYAGARSVVASLWEVSGESTAHFMASFYREVRSSRSEGRDHALAEAKRRWLRGDPRVALGAGVDQAHPFFWAPFILTGDGRRGPD